MSVNVKLINRGCDASTQESLAAIELKKMFDSFFTEDQNGEIIIAYSLTLTGQPVRDVDLLIIGKLENNVLRDFYTNDTHFPNKDLVVESFCTVMELKGHHKEDLWLDGTHIMVPYNGWKDATEQNENQKYAFANYFLAECQYNVKVSNAIWLKNLNKQQLESFRGSNPIGAFPDKFTFIEFVKMIIDQGVKPYYDRNDRRYHLCSSYNNEDVFEDSQKKLFVPRQPAQGLTKTKLENLIQKKVTSELSNIPIGKSLTIFEGRAGTGKTFRLIQAAIELANESSGKRCVLLTYNHALVSDIRRLLHFMDIPDSIDNYTIQISTLHGFFIKLMKALHIDTSKILDTRYNFESEYKKGLLEMTNYIQAVKDDNDIKHLKECDKLAIDWDFVLIDEGQDWSDSEKDILFRVYGSDRIIVADGVDQFSRSNVTKKQMWGRGVDTVTQKKYNYGLRQFKSIADFVNVFARAAGLSWNISTDKCQTGGRVLITGNYFPTLHKKLVDYNRKTGCENYDILFLVPHQMVSQNEPKYFLNKQKWEENNIKIFDGTSELKEEYPTKVDECRLYQYDSCRGLEGWITVCLHFDELIENKLMQAQYMDFSDSLAMESLEDKQKRYAYLWALMPLTRAIDTLVITIKNPDSEVGKILKDVANRMNDTVKWDIK